MTGKDSVLETSIAAITNFMEQRHSSKNYKFIVLNGLKKFFCSPVKSNEY
jgi:hypothetical protein